MFVIYCCITNDPKNLQLTGLNIYYLSLCGSGTREQCGLVVLIQGLSGGHIQDVGWSHLIWGAGKSISNLTHVVLAGIITSSLWGPLHRAAHWTWWQASPGVRDCYGDEGWGTHTYMHMHAHTSLPACFLFCHSYDKMESKNKRQELYCYSWGSHILSHLWLAFASGFLKIALQHLPVYRGLVCPLSLSPKQGDSTGFYWPFWSSVTCQCRGQ